ncbi:hypothetical protein B0A55_02565 [Friedmanniomyces simplex]|uniref:Acyl-protein thioesterase 1 n=1 Tax=Friedmanniomyces simplex TaxID=329884 RepID=A0A4U0XTF3_9PEZI|nr:hypothetical protein B0A55_02565 [Friedmanniomyces simplex]
MAARSRRMTLPSLAGRIDPIYKPATKPTSDPAHSAAFIFLHGLGDDAEGLENIADQFQKNDKVSYMHWVIPNAMEDRDAMTTAWYRPSPLTAFAPSRPELEEEEDEQGLVKSAAYVESLIDACVRKGIPPNRIVLGGFSQGCALSLFTDLTSKKYSGRLAGIVGLCGYLPLAGGSQLQHLRAVAELPPTHGDVPIFLARGKGDSLIPKRIWNITLKGLEAFDASSVEQHEYEGGHTINGPMLRASPTTSQNMAPIKKDAEDTKKEAKLTPEQSAALVLDYLRKQNRPYSATDISTNLKNRVTKAAAAKLLKDMHERKEIEGRAAGKQIVYHTIQAPDEASLEMLHQMDTETARLRDETVALKAEEKELQKALRGSASQVPLSELKASIAALEHDKAEMMARLAKLTSGSVQPIGVEEREGIGRENRVWLKAAAARKRIRGELWGVMAGAIEREKWEETQEGLGLEF